MTVISVIHVPMFFMTPVYNAYIQRLAAHLFFTFLFAAGSCARARTLYSICLSICAVRLVKQLTLYMICPSWHMINMMQQDVASEGGMILKSDGISAGIQICDYDLPKLSCHGGPTYCDVSPMGCGQMKQSQLQNQPCYVSYNPT